MLLTYSIKFNYIFNQIKTQKTKLSEFEFTVQKKLLLAQRRSNLTKGRRLKSALILNRML